jgi:hypothetical protein
MVITKTTLYRRCQSVQFPRWCQQFYLVNVLLSRLGVSPTSAQQGGYACIVYINESTSFSN